MKKIVLSLVAIMAFGFANAQDVRFGAKVGFNFSTINGLEDAETVEYNSNNERVRYVGLGDETGSYNDIRKYTEKLHDLSDLTPVTSSFITSGGASVYLSDTMYGVVSGEGIRGRINRFVSPGVIEIAELINVDKYGLPEYKLHTIKASQFLPIQDRKESIKGDDLAQTHTENMRIDVDTYAQVLETLASLRTYGYIPEDIENAIFNSINARLVTYSGAREILSFLANFDEYRRDQLKEIIKYSDRKSNPNDPFEDGFDSTKKDYEHYQRVKSSDRAYQIKLFFLKHIWNKYYYEEQRVSPLGTFPSSIIISLYSNLDIQNFTDYEAYLKDENNPEFIYIEYNEMELIIPKSEQALIVDGQHRIAGLELLLEEALTENIKINNKHIVKINNAFLRNLPYLFFLCFYQSLEMLIFALVLHQLTFHWLHLILPQNLLLRLLSFATALGIVFLLFDTV
jgi:hypothetical protein